VSFIERDRLVHTLGTQDDAPWGLSRISHHENPKGDSTYAYPDSAGEGVDVYVVDTGINIAHKDFGGRAFWGTALIDLTYSS
jgi:cerevisin